MRSTGRFAAILVSCGLAAFLAGCGDNHANISGTVYYQGFSATTMTPLADSNVSLLEGSSTISTQVSDFSGRYAFPNVDPGTYGIRAYFDKVANPDTWDSRCRVGSGTWVSYSSEHYGTSSSDSYIEYSGLTVAAGDDVTVDFRLAGY